MTNQSILQFTKLEAKKNPVTMEELQNYRNVDDLKRTVHLILAF